MRGFPPAPAALTAILALVLASAGCTGIGTGDDANRPSPEPTPGAQQTLGPTRAANFTWSGNFTALLPVKVHERTRFEITSYRAAGGPLEQGFWVLLVDAASPDKPQFLFDYYSIQQFSSKKQEDRFRGTFREECLSGIVRVSNADPPCTLFRTYDALVLNQTYEPFGEDLILEPLEGYFLVIGEEVPNLTVSFRFSETVLMGDPIVLPLSLQYLVSESFNATWQDLRRCGYISWCGAVVGGEHPFDLGSSQFGFLDLWGAMFNGAVARSCLRTASEERCANVVPTTIAGAYGLRLRTGLSKDNGPWTITLDAVANQSDDGTYRADFTYSTRILGYTLPDIHPLARPIVIE